MKQMTLGSLFDGSGGFPLAGSLCQIKPVWASEIEPFCIKVTHARFPEMRHLGNISELDGSVIEPVDIITFGSPCQDLSLAGRRKGLGGSRSGLFHEAIRVIKEMRRKSNGQKPEFIVWENVMGAFSSNGGADFREVLEEILSIHSESVHVPQPEKWSKAGCIVEDGFSLAWRVLDAQYWGVPQRRKRIFLVADLAGERAGKILFEPESLPGNSEKSSREEQTSSRNAKTGSYSTVCLNDQGGSRMSLSENITGTLRAQCGGHLPIVLDHHPNDSRLTLSDSQIVQTLSSRMGTGGGNIPLLMFWDGTQTSSALTCSLLSQRMPDKNQCGCVLTISKASHFSSATENIAETLTATDFKSPQAVYSDLLPAVRSLTPLECCRLQGFPDGWTQGIEVLDPDEKEMEFWRNVFKTWCQINGKRMKTDNQIKKWLKERHRDGAEYRMWGNGVALPCVLFVLSRISSCLSDGITDLTMS